MAACAPTPTLTLFSTVISTTIITTTTVAPQTQPDGTVTTVTLPLIITSIITLVNPTSTLYASCAPSSTPISTIPSTAQPSQTPTTVVITTTPGPTVVTVLQSATLDNGAVTVYTITSTSTPPPSVVTSVAGSNSSKSSSNIGPIAGGAAGGFLFLVGVVAITWYFLRKCRKADAVREEEDVVFPYPVTRDRDQSRRLDLTKESRPYEYGLVGRSTQVTAPGSSPGQSHNGRPDSATGLIGPSAIGSTSMASASGNFATIHDAHAEVGRQASYHSSLPLGAAPPDHYSHSGGSVSASSSIPAAPSNRRPLQVINSPSSPMPPLSGPSSGVVPSGPLAVYEPEKQSAWSEKTHARGPSSSSGVILSNDGHGRDSGPSGSGSGGVPEITPSPEPEHITGEPIDAPPAYAE